MLNKTAIIVAFIAIILVISGILLVNPITIMYNFDCARGVDINPYNAQSQNYQSLCNFSYVHSIGNFFPALGAAMSGNY
jgi:hypothetical protein